MKPLAQWPEDERRRIGGVLTDIDDTLTTHGRLMPDVLVALGRLQSAGLFLVAVTGRPTYWAMPLLRLCGFDAVIAENGASAFWLDAVGGMRSWFYADEATRRMHRQRLEAFVPVLQQRFSGIPVADDAAQRVGDLAFDIGENVPPRSHEQVAEVLAFIREYGFYAAASSIHVHASIVQFCKQKTTEHILADVLGVDDTTACETFAFIGDSGNDARMFAHYPQSVGVANIAAHVDRLEKPPAYVTPSPYGAGFIEFADAILAVRP